MNIINRILGRNQSEPEFRTWEPVHRKNPFSDPNNCAICGTPWKAAWIISGQQICRCGQQRTLTLPGGIVHFAGGDTK